MDINAERSLLIKEIKQVDDLSLLHAIKAVLHYGFKKEGKIDVEQYNRELDESKSRVESEKFIGQEDLENGRDQAQAKETAYLLSTPANTRRLLESIAQAKGGSTMISKSKKVIRKPVFAKRPRK